VTNRVVHPLEVIEVDVEKRAAPKTRGGGGELLIEPVQEEQAIRQRRERVVVRLTMQKLVARRLRERDGEAMRELPAALGHERIAARRLAITDGQDRLDAIVRHHRPHPEKLRADLVQRLQEAVAILLATGDREPALLGTQRLDHIQVELDAGYKRIKIKIAPHWDYDVIKKVREKFPDIPLMGDANSAYTLADIDKLRSLDEFDLMMLEQPLPYDDIIDHAELQRQIKTPICLDESIHSPADASHAISLGSCQIINLKLGRVGGHAEAKLVEQVCREQGIPVWCGGMLESGIGRAHNIAMSTLAGFTLPGDVSASERYWEEDIIEPPVTVSSRGTISVPTQPGLGFAVNLPRVESLTVRKQTIRSEASVTI